MWKPLRLLLLAGGLVAGASLGAQPIRPDHRVVTPTPEESQAAKVFVERVREYLVLRRKLEKTGPDLGASIAAARAGAPPGEFFSPAMQELVRRSMAAARVTGESSATPSLAVNDRFPDSMPPSTVPPQALEPLPKLDEDLEYRLVGKRLVLLDVDARLIVDVTDDILP